eukprot:g10315.t1
MSEPPAVAWTKDPKDQNDLKELREQVEAILKSKLRESDFLERQSYFELLQSYPEGSWIRVKDFLDFLFACPEAAEAADALSQNGSAIGVIRRIPLMVAQAQRQVQAGEAEKEQLKKQLENAKREAKDKEAQIEQLKNELQEAQQKAESRTTGQEAWVQSVQRKILPEGYRDWIRLAVEGFVLTG